MDFDKKAVKGIGLFAGGVAFGTAGIRILASRDAKKVYTNCAAAAAPSKRLGDENGDESAGERGRCDGRGKADQ